MWLKVLKDLQVMDILFSRRLSFYTFTAHQQGVRLSFLQFNLNLWNIAVLHTVTVKSQSQFLLVFGTWQVLILDPDLHGSA